MHQFGRNAAKTLRYAKPWFRSDQFVDLSIGSERISWRIQIEIELQEIIDYVVNGESSDRLSELDSRYDCRKVRQAFIKFLSWLGLRATVHQAAESFPGESYPGHKRLSETLHQQIFEVLKEFFQGETPLRGLFEADETTMEINYSANVDQAKKQQVQEYVKRNYQRRLMT